MKKPLFNMDNITKGKLDIRAGDYQEIFGGQSIRNYTPTPTIFSKSNSLGHNYTVTIMALKKTTPGTVERFKLAVKLFNIMGFHVKWDGSTKEPEVSWFDTEGWSHGFGTVELIRELLHKDYIDDGTRGTQAKVLHDVLKSTTKETMLVIDSYS